MVYILILSDYVQNNVVVICRLHFINNQKHELCSTEITFKLPLQRSPVLMTVEFDVRRETGHASELYCFARLYKRLSLSRNRRDPLKHFEISVLRYIRFVVLRKKQYEQTHFTNDYVI